MYDLPFSEGVDGKKERRDIVINDVTTAFAKNQDLEKILSNLDPKDIVYEDTKKITALGYGTRNPLQTNSVTALHRIDGDVSKVIQRILSTIHFYHL